MTTPQIIAAIFFVIGLLWVGIPFIVNRKEVWEGIKGDNHRLDIREAIGLMWLLMFPIIIFGELFLWFKLPTHAWYSLDTILLIITGSKVLSERNGKDKREAVQQRDDNVVDDSSLADMGGESMSDQEESEG